MIYRSIALAGLSLILHHCGDSNGFAGGSGKTQPVAPPKTEDAVPEPTPQNTQLTWHWQCEKAATSNSADAQAIYGQGAHELDPSAYDGSELVFTGQLCPPDRAERDIVLIIDSSGSMQDNDPAQGGSCGRLEATSTLFNIYGGSEEVYFAALTFSDGIDSVSSKFVNTSAELYRDHGNEQRPDKVFCAEDGGTNYETALKQAEHILKNGRPGASKEIYFLSDGEPSNGQDGLKVASKLKEKGVVIKGEFYPVMIATIMLRGDEAKLKEISSLDPDGAPLHAKVENSADLAKTLEMLASSEIVKAEIEYRFLDGSPWEKVSLDSYLDGSTFSIPATNLKADFGMEAIFRYLDNRNALVESYGKISWQSSTD